MAALFLLLNKKNTTLHQKHITFGQIFLLVDLAKHVKIDDPMP